MKRTGVFGANPEDRGRYHDSDVFEQQHILHEIEKYSKGVGSRILAAKGWKRGQPLGKKETRQSMIVDPVEADGQGNPKPSLRRFR
eukprot:m.242123 g.242123  ORF g.242123 m.242123 type:complete len:86 (+) comp16090_c0_seq2:1264-1521(+)